MKQKKSPSFGIRFLCESAMLLALGTVLSLIKIDMPFGGGVTLCSMLPLVLLSHRYGWKRALIPAFVYSLLQMLLGLDNVRYASDVQTAAAVIVLDYLLAYTVIGLSAVLDGHLSQRGSLAAGIALTFFARFVCHFVSGTWIWQALWPNELGMGAALYSLVYNGWYMGAELILTLVVAELLYRPLGKYFRGEDILS